MFLSCRVRQPLPLLMAARSKMRVRTHAVLQEVRNIVRIAECITQGQKDRLNDYVPIF